MPDNQQSGSSRPSGQQGGSSSNNQKTQLSWGQPANQPAKQSSSAPGAAPVGGSSSRMIGTFVAGLVIGLLVAWAWFDLRGAPAGGTSAMSTTSGEFAITQTPGSSETGSQNAAAAGAAQGSAQGPAVSADAITVPATQTAGAPVKVTSVNFSEGALWAVVYSNADRSGQIMGAARFAARHSGTIDLVHLTKPGHTYYVGLVADTPDHTYTPRVNQPILGSDGKQIQAEFTAQ